MKARECSFINQTAATIDQIQSEHPPYRVGAPTQGFNGVQKEVYPQSAAVDEPYVFWTDHFSVGSSFSWWTSLYAKG